MPRGERPLDAGDSPLLRFAAALRALRRRAGSPTYRELAARTHYSPAALSEAAGGRRLPSLAVTLAYVRACDGDVREWERRWREAAAPAAGDDAPVRRAEEGDAPYVGLAAYQRADAGRFFGREAVVEELEARLTRSRLVVLFGASGSGKSSVLRAGLLPHRWTDPADARAPEGGSDREGALGPALLLTPGTHPLQECAVQLGRLTGTPCAELLGELTADRSGLHRVVGRMLPDCGPGQELLVVVDQFEEVFTRCERAEERARFVDTLLAAATEHPSRCRVVLGARADFYPHCLDQPGLSELLDEAAFPLRAMTGDELRRAVVRPAVRAGCTVEGALLAELTTQAAGRPAALPLLSHALLETWRRRRGTTLTLVGHRATGGIDGALSRTAEELYSALPPRQQERTRHLLLRLVTPGEGTEDTRRRIDRDELDTDADTEAVLERLAAARLVTLDRGGVDLTHEALIRAWSRLHGWLAEDRAGLRLHHQISEAARLWESLGRDGGALLRGARLTGAAEWAAGNAAALSTRERDFLAACRAAQEDERALARRRHRRTRRLAVLLALLLVATSLATVHAVRAQRQATEQRDIVVSQRVADQASALRATDPALAAQLSLAAFRLSPTAEARGSLLETFAAPRATLLGGPRRPVHAVAFGPDGHRLAAAADHGEVRLWDVTGPRGAERSVVLPGAGPSPAAPDEGGTGAVALAFSPDGAVLAAAGPGPALRLWDVSDAAGAAEVTIVRLGHRARALAFSPDGRTLVAAGDGPAVRTWRVHGGVPHDGPAVRGGPDSGVTALAFHPDGTHLAAAGTDGRLRLWPTDGGRPPAPGTAPVTLAPHPGTPLTTVAFSPDGRTLAAGGENHTVRLWRTHPDRRPTDLTTVRAGGDTVRAVAFAPDGTTLATVGVDRLTHLWDVTDPRDPRRTHALPGHTGAVSAVAFRPGGALLATGGEDHTVRLWDLPPPGGVGHRSSVYGLAFHPGGALLASGSYDRTVRLWRTGPGGRAGERDVLRGHTAAVNAVAFHPGGTLLASGSLDHTVRTWTVTPDGTGREAAVLEGHTGAVSSVTFGSDGGVLAAGSMDGTVRLWDADAEGRPPPPTVLRAAGPVESVAAGPGGLLAAADRHHTVRLWDVSRPRHPRTLATFTAHSDTVKSAAFRPDRPGRPLLATAGSDRTARLWDLSDARAPRLLATLDGHTDTVYATAFSADGRTLATVSNDRTARLWDVTDPGRPRHRATLRAHTKAVSAVAFAPRGSTLATGGNDWNLHLWETDADRVAAHVCAHAHPRITPEAWRRHLTGIPYRPPCP